MKINIATHIDHNKSSIYDQYREKGKTIVACLVKTKSIHLCRQYSLL